MKTLKTEKESVRDMHNAAVKTLKSAGYMYHGGELWKPPIGKCPDWLIETPEEKEALDSLYSISREHLMTMIKKQSETIKELSGKLSDTPHQYEMGKFSGNEWNGEGLPPVGAIYTTEPNFDIELLCKYSSEYVVVGEMLPKETYKGMEVVIDIMEQRDRGFRKPETPLEKEQRERLEAAEVLYNTYMKVWDGAYIGWDMLDSKNKDAFLAIVDKTNHRKESN